MTDKEEASKMISAINQLDARLKDLEGEKKVVATQSVSERLRQERETRKTHLDHDRLVSGEVVPINPRRADEIRHRYANLPSPAQPQKRPHSTPTEDSVPIQFSCWSEGEICLITLKCYGPPSPIST